ncbi:HpcH/HpaI aldolase family protein [Microlunatus flavus]|uniref:4-hydroxy-2-oxoheptanedioate aldolase n=1 Tax=Microlunatus flavus TaxID=1036181 RepID=A0A1H9C7W5_9ACTN|nr:aldolase/citrate lyase family protein [Microlunatus flavus]SEP96758.1 4-hydroxy-2-oxoheptanedioate aldolase [Microlunatus flavus]
MSAVPSLKARLDAGERVLGALLRVPGEELVEMVAVAGFDFVLLDGEHGPADVVELRRHIAFAAVHGVPVLVRVGSAEPALVLRALDAGAQGVVAPHVDTPEQAAALVDSAHYPPYGHRGFATYGRSGRFGLVGADEHKQRALAETLVFGMIESPEGVRAVEAVVGTERLDGSMVGVADLAASSTPDDPPHAEQVRRVHDELAAQTKLRMDIVNSREAAERSFADGARLVVYNLTATVMAHLAELRGARS